MDFQTIKFFFKFYKLTNQQFNMLWTLTGGHRRVCTEKYIKEVMILTAPDITRLLDRLIEKEFVERKTCEQNRRKSDSIIHKF